MTKTFKVPFATQGDRTSIPNEVQADGAVSYTQGYGYDYERDQATDPAAKDIEREKMNSIFHDITGAVGEIQAFGMPVWAEEGKPYAIRSIVYHNKKAWQSKIENNNTEPAAGIAWTELKADLTAGEVGAYTKGESDQKFQPLGNYLPAGYSYSKAESDTNFQPKGNYAPAGNYAMKGDSYTKAEGDGRYQAKGNYAPAGDYATKTELGLKLDKTAVTQTTGSSTTDVMSQKAVTDELKNYPDMSAFDFSRNEKMSWDILPNGMIRQVGTVSLTPVGSFNQLEIGGVTYYTHYYRVNFPRQFPNAQISTMATLASYIYTDQGSMAGKSLSTHRDYDDSVSGVSKTRFVVAYTTPNLGETPTIHFESIGY